tara:strand:- start:564 stop:902 length:339 start_codon:yes stop_codon:yes gene_type:complete
MIITRKVLIEPDVNAPELRTNDGRIITRICYQSHNEKGESNAYPYTGFCKQQNGIGIDCQWNALGRTQLDVIRQAGIDEYDTPHLDMDRQTFSWVQKQISALHSLGGDAETI